MKPVGVTAVSDAATISTDANVDTITAATKQFSARVEFCSSWGMQRNYLQVKVCYIIFSCRVIVDNHVPCVFYVCGLRFYVVEF